MGWGAREEVTVEIFEEEGRDPVMWTSGQGVYAEGTCGSMTQGGRLPGMFEKQQEGSGGWTVGRGGQRGTGGELVKGLQATVRTWAFFEGDGGPWRVLSGKATLSGSCFNIIILATVENRLSVCMGQGGCGEQRVL